MKHLYLFWSTILLLAVYHPSAGQNIKAFYIGHSLSDQIPDMVKSLSDDHPDVSFNNWVYQSIPGAPLRWQWDRKDANDYNPIEPHFYGFYDSSHGLPAGDFDALVLTESVPRYLDIIDETYQYADSFFVYAYAHNPNLKVYLYEDWHCLLSGTPTGCDYDIDANPWRQRLSDDLEMWESVVDTLNKRYQPEKPVCLIPGGQGLARLYDSIQAGVIPEITQIEDLFSDRIHLNDVGKYFIACIHFATLHEKSPVGLTNQVYHWWGGELTPPSPTLAAKLQAIAWETANQYPNSCLDGGTTSVEGNLLNEEAFTLFPNPASTQLNIDYEGKNKEVKIYNSVGRLQKTVAGKTIDLMDLSKGIYLLKVQDQSQWFIKI